MRSALWILILMILHISVQGAPLQDKKSPNAQQPEPIIPSGVYRQARDSYGNPVAYLEAAQAPDGRKFVKTDEGIQFEIPGYASGITDIKKPSDDLLPPISPDEEYSSDTTAQNANTPDTQSHIGQNPITSSDDNNNNNNNFKNSIRTQETQTSNKNQNDGALRIKLNLEPLFPPDNDETNIFKSRENAGKSLSDENSQISVALLQAEETNGNREIQTEDTFADLKDYFSVNPELIPVAIIPSVQLDISPLVAPGIGSSTDNQNSGVEIIDKTLEPVIESIESEASNPLVEIQNPNGEIYRGGFGGPAGILGEQKEIGTYYKKNNIRSENSSEVSNTNKRVEIKVTQPSQQIPVLIEQHIPVVVKVSPLVEKAEEQTTLNTPIVSINVGDRSTDSEIKPSLNLNPFIAPDYGEAINIRQEINTELITEKIQSNSKDNRIKPKARHFNTGIVQEIKVDSFTLPNLNGEKDQIKDIRKGDEIIDITPTPIQHISDKNDFPIELNFDPFVPPSLTIDENSNSKGITEDSNEELEHNNKADNIAVQLVINSEPSVIPFLNKKINSLKEENKESIDKTVPTPRSIETSFEGQFKLNLDPFTPPKLSSTSSKEIQSSDSQENKQSTKGQQQGLTNLNLNPFIPPALNQSVHTVKVEIEKSISKQDPKNNNKTNPKLNLNPFVAPNVNEKNIFASELNEGLLNDNLQVDSSKPNQKLQHDGNTEVQPKLNLDPFIPPTLSDNKKKSTDFALPKAEISTEEIKESPKIEDKPVLNLDPFLPPIFTESKETKIEESTELLNQETIPDIAKLEDSPLGEGQFKLNLDPFIPPETSKSVALKEKTKEISDENSEQKNIPQDKLKHPDEIKPELNLDPFLPPILSEGEDIKIVESLDQEIVPHQSLDNDGQIKLNLDPLIPPAASSIEISKEKKKKLPSEDEEKKIVPEDKLKQPDNVEPKIDLDPFPPPILTKDEDIKIEAKTESLDQETITDQSLANEGQFKLNLDPFIPPAPSSAETVKENSKELLNTDQKIVPQNILKVEPKINIDPFIPPALSTTKKPKPAQHSSSKNQIGLPEKHHQTIEVKPTLNLDPFVPPSLSSDKNEPDQDININSSESTEENPIVEIKPKINLNALVRPKINQDSEEKKAKPKVNIKIDEQKNLDLNSGKDQNQIENEHLNEATLSSVENSQKNQLENDLNKTTNKRNPQPKIDENQSKSRNDSPKAEHKPNLNLDPLTPPLFNDNEKDDESSDIAINSQLFTEQPNNQEYSTQKSVSEISTDKPNLVENNKKKESYTTTIKPKVDLKKDFSTTGNNNIEIQILKSKDAQFSTTKPANPTIPSVTNASNLKDPATKTESTTQVFISNENPQNNIPPKVLPKSLNQPESSGEIYRGGFGGAPGILGEQKEIGFYHKNLENKSTSTGASTIIINTPTTVHNINIISTTKTPTQEHTTTIKPLTNQPSSDPIFFTKSTPAPPSRLFTPPLDTSNQIASNNAAKPNITNTSISGKPTTSFAERLNFDRILVPNQVGDTTFQSSSTVKPETGIFYFPTETTIPKKSEVPTSTVAPPTISNRYSGQQPTQNVIPGATSVPSSGFGLNNPFLSGQQSPQNVIPGATSVPSSGFGLNNPFLSGQQSPQNVIPGSTSVPSSGFGLNNPFLSKPNQNPTNNLGGFVQQSSSNYNNNQKFTGSFGGAPGILGNQKPGYAVQPDGSIKDPDYAYKGPSQNQNHNQNIVVPVKPPVAAPVPAPVPIPKPQHPVVRPSPIGNHQVNKYTGGFGGPPGVLEPYDNIDTRIDF